MEGLDNNGRGDNNLYLHLVLVCHAGHVDLKFLSCHWVDSPEVAEEKQ